VAPTPAQSLVEARKVGLDEGLSFVYVGNLPSRYSDYESTFCPKCNAPLVKRQGYLVEIKSLGRDGKCASCGRKIPGIWEKGQLKRAAGKQAARKAGAG
jgi:pyruvate formate lyase activating enzyme